MSLWSLPYESVFPLCDFRWLYGCEAGHEKKCGVLCVQWLSLRVKVKKLQPGCGSDQAFHPNSFRSSCSPCRIGPPCRSSSRLCAVRSCSQTTNSTPLKSVESHCYSINTVSGERKKPLTKKLQSYESSSIKTTCLGKAVWGEEAEVWSTAVIPFMDQRRF